MDNNNNNPPSASLASIEVSALFLYIFLSFVLPLFRTFQQYIVRLFLYLFLFIILYPTMYLSIWIQEEFNVPLQSYISGMKLVTALEDDKMWEKSIGHLVWMTLLQESDSSSYISRKSDDNYHKYVLSSNDQTLVEKQWKNLYSYFARFRREVLSDQIFIGYIDGLEIKFRVGNSNCKSEEEKKAWKTFPLKSLPVEVFTPIPTIRCCHLAL